MYKCNTANNIEKSAVQSSNLYLLGNPGAQSDRLTKAPLVDSR